MRNFYILTPSTYFIGPFSIISSEYLKEFCDFEYLDGVYSNCSREGMVISDKVLEYLDNNVIPEIRKRNKGRTIQYIMCSCSISTKNILKGKRPEKRKLLDNTSYIYFSYRTAREIKQIGGGKHFDPLLPLTNQEIMRVFVEKIKKIMDNKAVWFRSMCPSFVRLYVSYKLYYEKKNKTT